MSIQEQQIGDGRQLQARASALRFVAEEQAFRLGSLLTESSHPKTADFSKVVAGSLEAGIEQLLDVDREIVPRAREVMGQREFADLVEALVNVLRSDRRVFLTGCGATGRLSILLEAAWRRFAKRLLRQYPELSSRVPNLVDRVFSVMAGGDFALIRSVEGFEDFPAFGRHQLREAGVGAGDVVIATTEGGETPFVIGTVWEGLDAGARVFFVYNNPTAMLVQHVERSREVIAEPRVTKLDLTTGPMAIAGSTRMQAVTIELLVLGAAMEAALAQCLEAYLTREQLASIGGLGIAPDAYPERFAAILEQLSAPSAVSALAQCVRLEEGVYGKQGLVTYLADDVLLDILTDTTERSPTFSLPTFRKCDDVTSPRSWAFVKTPGCPTHEAWRRMLERTPRGLTWDAAAYERLKAPPALCAGPPQLDNEEIYKFRIGNEDDPSRYEVDESALIRISVGEDGLGPSEALSPSGANRSLRTTRFKRSARIHIALDKKAEGDETCLRIPCGLPASPLRLWTHLAVKLVFNTISTTTMARLGRIYGNWMVYVTPSNKKLIDRGTRLISQITGVDYASACIALHEAIYDRSSSVEGRQNGQSPVVAAIERIRQSSTRPAGAAHIRTMP
jgi:N-acetylmuramic acid 6-phosphate etherase